MKLSSRPNKMFRVATCSQRDVLSTPKTLRVFRKSKQGAIWTSSSNYSTQETEMKTNFKGTGNCSNEAMSLQPRLYKYCYTICIYKLLESLNKEYNKLLCLSWARLNTYTQSSIVIRTISIHKNGSSRLHNGHYNSRSIDYKFVKRQD